jgi:hypothetical protein
LEIPTLAGKNITITVLENGEKYVNDVPVIHEDYLISTGVMHILERSLDPNDTEARPGGERGSMPSSTSSPSSSSSPSNGSALSGGAKAGIGIGVAIGALVILGMGFIWRIQRNEEKTVEKILMEAAMARGKSKTATAGKVAVMHNPPAQVRELNDRETALEMA